MNDANTHLTPPPDSDLLERYVLRRATEEERARVERFARLDPAWRAALEHEQRLAAGIRRAGQLELKQKLAARLPASHIPAFPWTRYAAAAAVLVLLLSVALFNRWFAPKAPEAVQSSDGIAQLENAAHPSGTMEPDTPKPGAEPGGAAADADKMAGKKDLPRARTEPAAAARGADESGAKLADARSTVPAPAGEQAHLFWTQAYVLPPGETSPEANRLQGAAKSKEERALMQKGERAGAAADRTKETGTSAAPPPPMISLHRLPLSSLDTKQQMQFRSAGERMVPALVEQRNDSLHITLFTESPIDEGLLKGASVRQVAPDSFVISLPGETLGLQLPRGVESQQTTRVRK